ncbi:hypothetical protein QIA30_04905 [Borreliella turdi]
MVKPYSNSIVNKTKSVNTQKKYIFLNTCLEKNNLNSKLLEKRSR